MVNVGDKYIIEISEKICTNSKTLYRVKCCNNYVFDDNTLHFFERYKPITQEDLDKARREGFREGLKEGLNEAWEIAKKVTLQTKDGGYDSNKLEDIFCITGYQDVMKENSGLSAYKKVQKYEEKKKEEQTFHVGDEVEYKGLRYVITAIGDGGTLEMMDEKGCHCFYVSTDSKIKTGRSFPEVVEILQKLKEEHNE